MFTSGRRLVRALKAGAGIAAALALLPTGVFAQSSRNFGIANAIWGNRSGGKNSRTYATASAQFRGKDESSKLDRFLKARLDSGLGGWVSAVITLKGQISSQRYATLQRLGVQTISTMDTLKVLGVRMPVSSILPVAELNWVKNMSEDLEVSKMDEFTVKSSLADIAFSQYGVDGSDVAVAVLDSGIKVAPDIDGRVIASKSFVPNDPSTDDPCGHGTHVAGIIGGNGAASTGNNMYRTFYGIARNVNLVNVRVLDGQGKGTVSGIIQGIDWVIANKNVYKIKVMNLSLGHQVGESYTTDPLCQAVERAWKAGIVVVVAAGNSGRKNATATPGMDNEGYGAAYGSIESPGNSPYCITVGATKDVNGIRANDAISTFSSRGPSRLDFVLKPDLVAPGNRVVSLRCPGSLVDALYFDTNTIPVNFYKDNSNTNETRYYFRLSGTSMAAPVVAGAAALLLQRDSTLSPDSVKARLMISADKVRDAAGRYDVCSYGAGYLNIPAALECTAVATQSAISPTLSRDALGNVIVDEDNVIWGSNIIWGTNVIWGMSGVTSLNVIWGEYIAPATGVLDNIIWGSNIIWGTSVWTDNIIWGTNTNYDVRMNSIFGED